MHCDRSHLHNMHFSGQKGFFPQSRASTVELPKQLPPANGLAQGIAFSPDGQFVYIANGVEQNLVTFRIAGTKLVPEGSPLELPGHPASMRGSTP
jgi:DNA-binding beta-propeller fold protein YncE